MSERELSKLWGVGDRLIADVAKPSHVTDEIFVLGRSHRRCQSLSFRFSESSKLLSLGFLELPDRRSINLATRTCKTKQATDDGVSTASPMLKSDRAVGLVSPPHKPTNRCLFDSQSHRNCCLLDSQSHRIVGALT